MPYALTYTWSNAAKILITVDFQIVYVTEFCKHYHVCTYKQLKYLESLNLNLCDNKSQANQLYLCNYSGN